MKLFDELKKDVRFIEGLKACINCGTCTAICPAAQFYEYDPRRITILAQSENEEELEELLKSDAIWFCGECLSCKTRCPRGNTPGYIIQSLRNLSISTGYFSFSDKGREQLKVIKMVGENMLKHGYCVYIDEIDTTGHPEQGPVWDWYRANAVSLLKKMGGSYKQESSGTLRNIPGSDMDELLRIFDETGATEQFFSVEEYCNGTRK